MSSLNLLTTTVLGSSIPLFTPHAICTSLPTWEDNVSYRKGEKRVVDSVALGYPRFDIPPSVRKACGPPNPRSPGASNPDALHRLCSSWPVYASKGLTPMAKGVYCFPPRPSRIIVALSSFNRLPRTMPSSRFVSLDSSSIPIAKTSSAQSYTSSCSPLTSTSTRGLSGSTRDWGSPAVTPNTACPSFPKRSPRLSLPPTPDRNPLTHVTPPKIQNHYPLLPRKNATAETFPRTQSLLQNARYVAGLPARRCVVGQQIGMQSGLHPLNSSPIPAVSVSLKTMCIFTQPEWPLFGVPIRRYPL